MGVQEYNVKSLYIVEIEYILFVLKLCDGCRSEAARALQISRRKLYNKISEAKNLRYKVEPAKRCKQL
jgi:DNA-binding NtrC family response regulator